MATIAPQYSPEEVDRAGRTLVLAGYADSDATGEVSEAERLHAVDVVNQWRASHARSLDTFREEPAQKSRKKRCRRTAAKASSVSKLERLPRIRLSRMQDIGGCRAIVPTIGDAFSLASDVVDSKVRHVLARLKNYTTTPETQGIGDYT